MTDAQFWSIIAQLDWTSTAGHEAGLAPAVGALATLGPGAITAFADRLAAKLHALDTRAHARQMGVSAYRDEDPDAFSADAFLYARCAVVVNGPAYYAQVLAEPRHMPKDVEFEALLVLPAQAYELATGDPFDHLAQPDFETFANRVGWAPGA
jgi:hypothetical protein